MDSNDVMISIKEVTKRFGSAVTAVDNVSIDIKSGEFFALLGPSGCGKTTLLRMIAGFELPTAGQITIDGQDMEGIAPNHRPINMVFQSYAVFPHMTVSDNVAYGLKVGGVPSSEIKPRVEEALDLVKLGGYGPRKPDQLSGGQRQRVALARALVKRPKVLLLDEPLSALDAKLREAMQLELVRLQHTVGITFIVVTHDQKEALSMANRIAVMDSGRVRQLASPSELYENPNCQFVADFIGKTNLLQGKVTGLEGGAVLVEVPGVGPMPLQGSTASGDVGLAIRPEKMRLRDAGPGDGEVGIKGRVTEIAYFGEVSFVYLEDEQGRSLSVAAQNDSRGAAQSINQGHDYWCCWKAEDAILLTE
ncbi:MAG: ABC transporter ATP-binding protein [Pseudomonadota bacterium]